MLETLHVRNFAIIDEVVVDFSSGMNVLTGETGAGKSILVDALGLVLGDRASADVLRAGADRAEIAATFRIAPGGAAARWLADNELDADGDCLLRRIIGADGRSRGFINGNPVPMHSLRALGAHLVTIHGQHEHQSLQRGDEQRDMLDARGGLVSLRREVAGSHSAWEALAQEHEALAAARAQRNERLALLDFQLRELDALAPVAGEFETLQPEHARLANAGRLAEASAEALDALYEREPANVQSLLTEAARQLRGVVGFDDALAPALALLDEAEVSVSEAADVLRRYGSDIDADPGRLDQVESRLAALEAMARKHRVDAEALPAHAEALRTERDTLTDSDQRLEALAAERDAALDALRAAAARLGTARRGAATAFAAEVTRGMQALGMPGGEFTVRVTDAGRDAPAAHGADRVVFEVAANPGQPAQPVARVASGGELSRISLAIQAAAGRSDRTPCMIFDEVDSGVGGGVAEIVGREMRGLANDSQVLAVTHLPQVAGQAHHHLRVSKISDGKTTRTTVAALTGDARIEEIARMLGGVDITETSREHAREMLKSG